MSRRRPVLLLTQEFHPSRGGVGTYVEQLARAMSGTGRDVTVLAPRHAELDAFAAKVPYAVRQLAMPANSGWPARLRVAQALRPLASRIAESTLVVAEGASLRAMIYAMAPGLPWPGLRPADLRVVLHGSELVALTRYLHRRRLLASLLDRSGGIGVVSAYVRGLLAERYPTVLGRARLVPGAVRGDLALTPRTRPTRAAHEPLHVLSVARLHPRKGQLALVEALSALPQGVRGQVRCTLVGPSRSEDYRSKVLGVAHASGLSLAVPGAVDEVTLDALYADADVFAMPSMPAGNSVEGLGLACLEASAAGIPVVAHRIGGVGEAVADGQTGILADPGDRATLTDAFAQLIASPSLRARLGANGPAFAAGFSWTRSAERLLS